MCLKTAYSDKEKEKLKSKISAKGLTVYKVVGVKNNQYFPTAKKTKTPYKVGEDLADTTNKNIPTYHSKSYVAGFHFFLKKKDAKHYMKKFVATINDQTGWIQCMAEHMEEQLFEEYIVIKCVVKKSWITTYGGENLDTDDKEFPCIVTKKAIFPEFRK